MKKINRILGVVLVLAMLAGSLFAAAPVAAADDAWTDVTDNPSVVMTPNATNLFTVAADGTTMYMHSQITTTTTAATTGAGGETVVNVGSTAGFAPPVN
jgi:alcohol dehydrogenase YqhD (iron-dependent ADH family)